MKLVGVLLTVAALLDGQRRDAERDTRPIARVLDEHPEDRPA